MDDKKREETTPVSSEREREVVDSSIESETQSTNRDRKVTKKAQKPFKGMSYVVSFVVILVIAVGLVFVLEREGRISTGIFSGITEKMQANAPSAKVNGVVIPKKDFDSSVSQLVEIARAQGENVEDPEVVAQFKSQAIETLVNGELLRQKAVESGITASDEEIDSRYSEISEGIGGEEILQERMAEFGITEEGLRRDIKNEILIQGLFDQKFADEIEVTDEEARDFYEQAGGAEAELPPFEEISEQIKEQIKVNRQQQRMGDYIDELRAEAEIEILI